jgi:acyl-CoA dehydrogenase
MPIVLGGNEALQKAWLPRVIQGEAMAAFAMTEPNAGSDVVNMSTRARRKGEEYIIDGEKHLITNAGIADFYTVFAVTDPDVGHRGISCFLVPADSPGLRFTGPQILSEPHPLGHITFEECRVSSQNLLGGEGDGFKLGMATLDRLRPTVAAAACGMAGRALYEAVVFSKERHQFGQPVSTFQSIQQMLAEMAIELTAARMLVFQAAWEKDQGTERITIPAAKAKAFATEAAQRIIDKAVQILGGRGVLVDQIVERLYRAIRPLRIYEGTTQVQHLIIARDLLEK